MLMQCRCVIAIFAKGRVKFFEALDFMYIRRCRWETAAHHEQLVTSPYIKHWQHKRYKNIANNALGCGWWYWCLWYNETICSPEMQSDSCVGTHSRLIQLFVYDATAFYNVSGYCFLILKFPVVPPDAKKCGYKQFSALLGCTPHFQKTWRRPCQRSLAASISLIPTMKPAVL